MAVAMNISDIWTLIRKDILTLWRDRSLIFIVLLWLAPLGGLLRPPLPLADFQARQHHSDHGGSIVPSHVDPSTMEHPGDASTRPNLGEIKIAVIGGDPILLDDPRFRIFRAEESKALPALQYGTYDILAKFPTEKAVRPALARITIIHKKGNDRSETASDIVYSYLHKKQFKRTEERITSLSSVGQSWVLYTTEFSNTEKNEILPTFDSKLYGIGGAFVLAAALMATLVMLTTVEENSQHTLPLVLVCAVDRKTVFASKLVFCMLPCVAAVFSGAARTWRALPAVPSDLWHRAAIIGVSLASGIIFVVIAGVILLVAGGKARTNIDALAKVGGPLVLSGFLVIAAMTPLAPVTPGLFFLPLTNLVMSFGQLISPTPNWWLCATALISSSLFAALLLSVAYRSFRCEEGLPGELSSRDVKLDGLLIFLLAASVLSLLFNFVGLPCRIVYPSIGDLAVAAIFALVATGIVRTGEVKVAGLLAPGAKPSLVLAYSVAAIVIAPLTAWCFATLSSSHIGLMGTPEALRIESLTRSSAAPLIVVTLSIIRIICEELALRGALVGLLVGRYADWVIILMMTAISAVIHPFGDAWLVMAPLGGLLTFMRLRCGSTIPCIVLHVCYQLLLWMIWNRLS